MQKEIPQKMFVQWLNRALTDERGRALIRAALRQYELPVIDLESRPRRRLVRARA